MKNRNLIDSFNNAANGIIYAVRNERNIKIHIVAAIVVLILSLFYELTRVEFLIVCITIGFVITCELFNTAIEVIVDIIVPVYHPKAKIVKDVAAGAVLVSAFVSLMVGYFIFFDRISTGLETGIIRIRQIPMHITVICLMLTLIAVLIFKAFFGRGTPFHGGMPSGHSALAFSISTAITLWTTNIKVSILCFLLALMVLQSRLEGKIHNRLELAAGAVLGSLISLLMFQFFYL